MDPPSLHDIASRKVAYYILEGKYNNVDFTLLKDASNIIFDIVKEQRIWLSEEEFDQVNDVLMRMVNPSIMNLPSHTTTLSAEESDLRMMKKQNLEELSLAVFTGLKKYVKEKTAAPPPKKKQRVTENKKEEEGKPEFDLPAMLDENLNEKTKQELKALNLSECAGFRSDFTLPENWTQSISQLLPSLTSLKIAEVPFTNKEFLVLCDSFPRLQTLDIEKTAVTSVKGIHKLTCLQDLSLAQLNLANSQSMDDIYKLGNLRKLNLSDRYGSNVMKLFIKSKKTIPNLMELNCSNFQHLEDGDMIGIIKRHPKLKKVIAFMSPMLLPDAPGVEFITLHTISSCLGVIDYIRESQPRRGIMDIVFQVLIRVHQTPIDELTGEELRAAIRKMYQLIPEYEHSEHTIGNVESCCDNLSNENKLHFYNNDDKRILLESLMMLMDLKRIFSPDSHPRDHVWQNFTKLLKSTQDPQVDRIVSMAIKYFLMADGKRYGLDCLDAIDHLLERIDMEAEDYKGMEKEKLIVGLKKVRTPNNVKKEMKQKAERVLRFFENL